MPIFHDLKLLFVFYLILFIFNERDSEGKSRALLSSGCLWCWGLNLGAQAVRQVFCRITWCHPALTWAFLGTDTSCHSSCLTPHGWVSRLALCALGSCPTQAGEASTLSAAECWGAAPADRHAGRGLGSMVLIRSRADLWAAFQAALGSHSWTSWHVNPS